MKLADILDSPTAHHVNGRPIDFIVIGINSRGESVQAPASAKFRFVNEQERAELFAKADAEVAKRYDGKAPFDRQIDERNYYLLHAALRDADSPSDPFAVSVMKLRNSLVREEAQRIYKAYEDWIEEEFPAHVDDAEMAKLIEEAKKNSMLDLLTSYGFKRTLSALRSLAATSGEPSTRT